MNPVPHNRADIIAALPRHDLTMNDGARLSVVDVGTGQPIVILPSWSTSVAQYHGQITDLSRDYRVVAIDYRAHGLSEKVDFGLHISRLSADLSEIINTLAINRAILLGHSMGCSIIWSYLELFGPQRVSALVLVDQAATQLIQPHWSPKEVVDYGATYTPKDLFDFVAHLVAPKADDWTRERYRPLFTDAFPRKEFDWTISEILQAPRKSVAELFLDHSVRDWRSVIQRIRLPTLVVGAELSVFPVESQMWIANQIPNAQLEIFARKDGGSHFMCFENPPEFNRRVRAFIARALP
jgi:pimeloyl-ACP methyl ester carboxylesterase